MELDKDKINETIAKLNKETGKDVWFMNSDFMAVTKVELNSEGGADFFPASGIPLVALVNSDTGELRLFHVNAFKGKNGEK